MRIAARIINVYRMAACQINELTLPQKNKNDIKMRNRFTRTLIIAFTLTGAMTAAAQIPEGYYNSLKGKKGAELKNAVHEIIRHAKVLSYGSGSGHTWEGFYSTDRTDDNQVVDRYSNDIRYFGNKGSVVGGMNIEHSFPKSWWGGSKNQAYQDLYNLMPSESGINSKKSNYPMGKVTNDKNGNGCTKVGTGSNGYQLWEPADKWKGDFARSYMYMATTYQNLSWTGAQAKQILQDGAYPTLQKWAYTLYIEWAKSDVPDQLEIKRNNEVCKIQGNRNPFIDFPNLMEYIWGDSTSYAFNPETTVKTSEYGDGGGGGAQPGEMTIYYAKFTSEAGGCVAENVSVPDNSFNVWTRSTKYGWVGTGHESDTKNWYAVEGRLTTPEIDLTNYSNATLTFNHAVNFCASPGDTYTVEVMCEGTTTSLDGITWPKGNTWDFNDSGDIDLSAFKGKKINIAFNYRSTASEAGTWEIKWVMVKGNAGVTGIQAAETDDTHIDLTKPYRAYTADGRQIGDLKSHRGLTIIRQEGKSMKMMMK